MKFRKLIYPILIICYFFEWLFSLLGNLSETFANKFEEICIALENFINAHEAEPISEKPPATPAGKKN